MEWAVIFGTPQGDHDTNNTGCVNWPSMIQAAMLASFWKEPSLTINLWLSKICCHSVDKLPTIQSFSCQSCATWLWIKELIPFRGVGVMEKSVYPNKRRCGPWCEMTPLKVGVHSWETRPVCNQWHCTASCVSETEHTEIIANLSSHDAKLD